MNGLIILLKLTEDWNWPWNSFIYIELLDNIINTDDYEAINKFFAVLLSFFERIGYFTVPSMVEIIEEKGSSMVEILLPWL